MHPNRADGGMAQGLFLRLPVLGAGLLAVWPVWFVLAGVAA
ncbi:MAG: hypothetical protein ABF823_07460 [Acetobacter syzygii]